MNRRKRKKHLKQKVDDLMDFTTNYYIPAVFASDPLLAFLCGENVSSCELSDKDDSVDDM